MSVDLSDSHPAMDMEEHRKTYEGFVRATTIGTVAMVLLMILMAVFLV